MRAGGIVPGDTRLRSPGPARVLSLQDRIVEGRGHRMRSRVMLVILKRYLFLLFSLPLGVLVGEEPVRVAVSEGEGTGGR